jgi:hypothetical protein
LYNIKKTKEMKKIKNVISVILIVCGIFFISTVKGQNIYNFIWDVAEFGSVNQSYGANLVVSLQPGTVTRNASFKTTNSGVIPVNVSLGGTQTATVTVTATFYPTVSKTVYVGIYIRDRNTGAFVSASFAPKVLTPSVQNQLVLSRSIPATGEYNIEYIVMNLPPAE